MEVKSSIQTGPEKTILMLNKRLHKAKISKKEQNSKKDDLDLRKKGHY
jgi:hypothetical protein